MSMHLVSPALSTTRTSRRRKKLSNGQLKKFQTQWREHNQFLKRMKMNTMTFEEFVDYMHGNLPSSKKAKPNYPPKKDYVSSKEIYPSLDLPYNEIGNTVARREENIYTGKRLIGIAVMHKSNLVPVFSREDAIEVSKMRRG